ncbi:uncharacterized protein DSM5745_04284 [Aspergillus mulundensis]|uniref:Phospholipase/carboxylesterase/thioesterase domain-containing protein n=1 Tax=Aspergillus mulundensis TaxID=1810919 RepID=A0A3D8SDX8_9EURO|nr:hypothetical protein DSM5745_04284 [Aspergillus mulundensis]RDW83958.1 hypothetical protein DSM5745_04284 [Aspergillus mulundensis]
MSTTPFPIPHIIPPHPDHPHTHTAILLHGRGSCGREFAEDLFTSHTSQGINLPTAFPTWRWVLPTSRVRWSSLFQEEMCAWFGAGPPGRGTDGLNSDTGAKHQEQEEMEGLRESVEFIVGLVEREVGVLEGQKEKVFLGGMSQGMATGLWTLLSLHASLDGRLGGFLGMCGWLPFAEGVAALGEEVGDEQGKDKAALGFFSRRLFGDSRLEEINTTVLSTPVLLMHGTDDVWVPVELGRLARSILEGSMGLSVEWLDFTGAENDGHWVKEPEGFDRIAQFFSRRSNEGAVSARDKGSNTG